MCILFVALRAHPEFPLLIAANRDEFHARPTTPSGFWPAAPGILAGKDLQAGGTWMGVSEDGRVAALTNIREPSQHKANSPSRGHLVSGYLTNTTPQDYAAALKRSKTAYNGYNLLFGNWQNLAVYNNKRDELTMLTDGIYGLSNADIHSPWPKTSKGVARLTQFCQQGQTNTEILFSLLKDDVPAEDHLLPSTGVAKEWEKRLSAIFIQSEQYGTRTSTLLMVNKHAQASWYERSFSASGVVYKDVSFHFPLREYL
ncbi:NRDE family protein [Bowmanella denitrificans]|uniref:NRDE family protein n=1 Tax=Bowmanella denitrificans TaxID=366582 RepID=A0ABN0X6Z1_9ALTE